MTPERLTANTVAAALLVGGLVVAGAAEPVESTAEPAPTNPAPATAPVDSAPATPSDDSDLEGAAVVGSVPDDTTTYDPRAGTDGDRVASDDDGAGTHDDGDDESATSFSRHPYQAY